MKPSQPVISGPSTVTEGSSRTFQCSSSGCRPEGGMSWKYGDVDVTRSVRISNDTTTETYTMTSDYSTGVLQRKDNGKTLECIVTHETLTNPTQLTQSTVMNVRCEYTWFTYWHFYDKRVCKFEPYWSQCSMWLKLIKSIDFSLEFEISFLEIMD